MLDELFDKFEIDELEEPAKATIRADKKAVVKRVRVTGLNAFGKKYVIVAAVIICIILYEFALCFEDTDLTHETTTGSNDIIVGYISGNPVTLSENDININENPLTREEISHVFIEDEISSVVSDIKKESESRDRLVASGYAEDNPCKNILENGGFYVSAIAYQAYSLDKQEMAKPLLIVFDKDINYVGNIRLSTANEEYKYEKIILRPDELYVADIMKKHRSEDFVSVYYSNSRNGMFEAYITAQNEVYQKNELLELRGDVYDKLSAFSFSYDRFTSLDNLIWISID